MSPKVRETTCRLLEMIDEGVLDAKAVVEMFTSYNSEADVAEMCRLNEIFFDDEDEEDEEE